MTSGRKYLALCSLAAVLALAACDPGPTMPADMDPVFSKGQGGGRVVDPTATWLIPLADAGLALRSDGLHDDGTHSVYADGVCGVSATIYATQQRSNSGDATIQTNTSGNGNKACSRLFTVAYPDGITEEVRSFNNLRNLQNTTTVIPVGAEVKRLLILNPGVMEASTRCGRLLFGTGDNPLNGAGSDSVLVERLDARTWRVRSDGDDNLAWCQNTGELFSMPVDFLVVASRDLPE